MDFAMTPRLRALKYHKAVIKSYVIVYKEVRDQKAVQVRGMQNAEATPEVRAFIFQWERQVLQRQDLEPAA